MVAIASLILGSLVAVGLLLTFSRWGLVASISAAISAFLNWLLFRCLAEHLRLQKKIAGCDFRAWSVTTGCWGTRGSASLPGAAALHRHRQAHPQRAVRALSRARLPAGRDSAPVFVPPVRDYAEASLRVPDIRCITDPNTGSCMVSHHGMLGNARERVPTWSGGASSMHASPSATGCSRALTSAATD